MAVYNIFVTSKTMAGKDTTQDANRTHSAANYTWVVNNGKSHQYYYNTSAPAGKANFHIESTLSTIGDDVFKIVTGLGDAVEVKGNKKVFLRGDASVTGNLQVERIENPFDPSKFIGIYADRIDITKGIRITDGVTTAQRLALDVLLYERTLLYDNDTKSYWYSNGTIWVSVGKPAEFTTAQRTALNVAHYRTLAVFDTDTNTLWFSDGTNWIEL